MKEKVKLVENPASMGCAYTATFDGNIHAVFLFGQIWVYSINKKDVDSSISFYDLTKRNNIEICDYGTPN